VNAPCATGWQSGNDMAKERTSRELVMTAVTPEDCENYNQNRGRITMAVASEAAGLFDELATKCWNRAKLFADGGGDENVFHDILGFCKEFVDACCTKYNIPMTSGAKNILSFKCMQSCADRLHEFGVIGGSFTTKEKIITKEQYEQVSKGINID
jgi:hypothetical protein